MDQLGNVFLSDTGNKLIRKLSPAGIVSTVKVAGLGGRELSPGPLTLDSLTGDLYVCEGDRLLRIGTRDKGSQECLAHPRPGRLSDLCFAGKRLFFTGADGLTVFDPATCALEAPLGPPGEGEPTSLCPGQDGDLVVVSSHWLVTVPRA